MFEKIQFVGQIFTLDDIQTLVQVLVFHFCCVVFIKIVFFAYFDATIKLVK